MVPLMSESMDRRLGFIEKLKLRLHLLVCAWCAHYLKQIELLGCVIRLESMTGPNAYESAASLTPEARERITKALSS
jgi:hypothetical protein